MASMTISPGIVRTFFISWSRYAPTQQLARPELSDAQEKILNSCADLLLGIIARTLFIHAFELFHLRANNYQSVSIREPELICVFCYFSFVSGSVMITNLRVDMFPAKGVFSAASMASSTSLKFTFLSLNLRIEVRLSTASISLMDL